MAQMDDKRTIGQRLLAGLSEGGMALAQGLTAAGGNEVPYYTNYLQKQADQARLAQDAQRQYQDFQMAKLKAKTDSRETMAKAGYYKSLSRNGIPSYEEIAKQFGGEIPVGTTLYDKRTGVRIPLNKETSQDTQGAVAAYNYAKPRFEQIKSLANSLDGNALSKLAKQVTVSEQGDLIVPDGSPLEDIIGHINDIRLTGFGLGGKNFTESEARIVFGRLSPVGKSKERWLKDIDSLPAYFEEKVKAGTGGTMAAKNIGKSNGKSYSDLWS